MASCVRCAAPLPPVLHGLKTIRCTHCSTNQPALTDQLIAHLDFRTEGTPGFHTLPQPSYEADTEAGELIARMGPGSKSALYTVLRSHDVFGDVDLSVTLRVIEGLEGNGVDRPGAYGGLSFRLKDVLCYVVTVTTDGRFSIGAIDQDIHGTRWDHLVARAPCEALERGLGAPNRIRVVANADKIRLWLNGTLAASLRDYRFRQGKLEILVNPRGAPCTLGLSDLVLAEP
ncbi:MAG TPA: hypothetical protein ENK18_27270 [Deltaproteobacteria bacterium]|nr:hypothetical protein [Deltaproteobacteria bacterium]